MPDLGFKVIINTNGSIKKSQIASLVEKEILYLSVSLDAPTELANDLLRGRGSFRSAINTIEWATQLGIRVRVSPTVGYHNIEAAYRLPNFLGNMGVSLANFHRLTLIGHGQTAKNLVVSPGDWYRFAHEMRDNSSSIGIRIPPVYVTVNEMNTLYRCGYRGCEAQTEKALNILPNGQIFACGIMLPDSKQIHDVVELKCSDTKSFRIGIPRRVMFPKCKDCSYSFFCNGSCAYGADIEKNWTESDCLNPFVLLCPLWRVSTQTWRKESDE